MGPARRVRERGTRTSRAADSQYDCIPLQWALHGWVDGAGGRRNRIPAVAAVLREHGARVAAGDLDALPKDSDTELREALGVNDTDPTR